MYHLGMVGNEADALYALQLDDSSDEYLDEGGYRRAFVVNSVVYKVPYVDVPWPVGYVRTVEEWQAEFQAGCLHSFEEWGHYNRWAHHFTHPFYVPEMSLYCVGPDDVPVIASQWIIGESDWEQTASDFAHLMPKHDLMDLCDSNIIRDGDRYWIIDLGC